jgi:hypothetical protein
MQSFDEYELRRVFIIGQAFAHYLGYRVIAVEGHSILVFSYGEDRVEPVCDTGDTEENFSGPVFVQCGVSSRHADNHDHEDQKATQASPNAA